MLVSVIVLLVFFALFYNKFRRRKEILNTRTSNQNRSTLSISSSSILSNQYESYTNLSPSNEMSNKKYSKSKKDATDKEILNLDKSCQVMASQFDCANVRTTLYIFNES